MGEENKNGATLNLLENIKSQINPDEFPNTSDINLNLGLSLGGSYTQIPAESPSNENFIGHSGRRPFMDRLASLMPEMVAEMKNSKEVKAMNRMEAKRRLVEKRAAGCVEREYEEREEEVEEEEEEVEGEEEEVKSTNRAISMKTIAFRRALEKLKSSQAPEYPNAAETITVFHPESGSSEVKAYGKSPKLPENGPKSVTIFGTKMDGKSAYPVDNLPEHVPGFEITHTNGKSSHSPDTAISSGKKTNRKEIEPAESSVKKSQKIWADSESPVSMNELMRQMPSVRTVGTGGNGREIEGILFRYMALPTLSIVCLCHGDFLSPADFVKHAGGTDVENPLKHIVVMHAKDLV